MSACSFSGYAQVMVQCPRASSRVDSPDPLQVFFFAAALALAAFFLLLLIITMPMKVPTTADPRRARMTGMRMAQTRGGKRSWRGWPGSTKGYHMR